METIRQTQIKYCSRALIISITAGLFFLIAEYRSICRGLILGTLFSIINFCLIGAALPYKLNKSRNKSFFLSIGSLYFRYAILAIPIVLAIKDDQYNLYAAITGIFSVQLVLISDHLANYLFSMRHKKV